MARPALSHLPRIAPALRLALLPLAAVLLFGLLIWLGNNGLDLVISETRQIVGRNLDGSVRMAEFSGRLQRINAAAYALIAAKAANGDKLDVPVQFKILDIDIDTLLADLADYQGRFATPQQLQTLEETQAGLADYQGALRWVASMLEIDFNSAVSFLRPFNEVVDRMVHRFDETTAAAVIDARNRATQAALSARQTVQWFIVVTLAAAVGIALFAWMIGRYQQQLRINAQVLEGLVAARTRELEQRSADLQESLTRLKETQTRLVMQEKMASLGQLVAGVAQEINTPKGVALTSASFLAGENEAMRASFQTGKLRRSDLEQFLNKGQDAVSLLVANIRRSLELVQSFKLVAADQTRDDRQQFELRPYLGNILISLEPSWKKAGHTVSWECPEAVMLESYPGALIQILTQLINNSLLHAFDAGQSGRLAILASLPDPETLELIYSDTGKGIPAEYRGRIFDPFFTTRRGTGCTGLGLHIVFNLVTGRLGGQIRLDERVTRGTRFVIRFPRRLADAAARA
jgi:signal transduction histidine kinase